MDRIVTEGHIYKMPIEGGTPIQLTFSNAPSSALPGLRMASESRSAPMRAELRKVWIVDADGANRRQFARLS
jgi:hypothetical protein